MQSGRDPLPPDVDLNRCERLQGGLRAALDHIVARNSLAEVLAALVHLVESCSQTGVLASIFLLDKDGTHLQLGAAPSLSAGFVARMERIAVGPCAASSGTAIYRHATVHVADIEHDPLWEAHRAFALPYGLRAAWATPILSSHSTALGAFALYYDRVCEADSADIDLAAVATRTAAIAIERHRAQNLLDDSEWLLRSLVESIPVALYTCNAQGQVQLYNHAAVDLLGRPQAGHDAWNSLRLFDADGNALAHPGAAMPAVLRGENPPDIGEVMVNRADGSRRVVRPCPRALRDASGRIVGAVNVLIDVTHHNRMKEALWQSEERAAQALAVARLGTWRWEPASGAVEADARCREIAGLGAEPAFSMAEFCAHVHVDDRPRLHAALADALRPDGSGLHVGQFRVVHGDGSVRWLGSRAQVAFTHGQASAMIGTLLDITENKTSEAALFEADRRKDEFLATLAHELRNPLVPLRSYLHVMRTHAPSAEQAAHMTEVMERQVDTMVRLVDDLLEISRITRGTIELHLETVDLADVLQRAVETSRPLIEGAHHQLSMRLEHNQWTLRADRVRLAQVFANILNNAAKYSSPHSRIEIDAHRDGESVVVDICDNGIGIAKDMLAHVFDMFAQIGDMQGIGQHGLGIGLSLVRELVALHGGSVQAHSEGRGRGSRFSVCLPLAGGDAAERARRQDHRPGGHQ